MTQITAGILMYRLRSGSPEVLLVHPGGPFWEKKDLAAWSIPKGLPEPGEKPVEAAIREFREETGCSASGRLIPLSPVRLRSGKTMHAWALEGDCDASGLRSNTFSIEWPPRSGSFRDFPETDRAEWFGIPEAKEKINKGQVRLIGELEEILIAKE